MDDNEIDSLIEMYLNERGGLVGVYRRQIKKGSARGHAFFMSCTMKDADRIREILPIFGSHMAFLHNDDICGLIQILLDTE